MSDDKLDNLRRAAGLPTNAERQELEEQKRQQHEAWERGAPKRGEDLARYREVLVPLVDQWTASSKEIVIPIGYSIEETRVFSNIPQILAQRTFQLQPKTNIGPHPRPLGTLHITLDSDGKVRFEVPKDSQSAGPTAAPIHVNDVQSSDVEGAFVQLLSKIRR